jgi:hypothetical protein
MRRRQLITRLGGLVALPLAAGAQQSGKVFRIGILANYRFGEPDLWAVFIRDFEISATSRAHDRVASLGGKV